MEEQDINGSIGSMVELLRELCPNLSPTILPSQCSSKNAESLCAGSAVAAKVLKKIKSLCGNGCDSHALETEVDYSRKTVRVSGIVVCDEIDATLYSLEKVMKMLLTEDNRAIEMYANRFLEVNNHPGDVSTLRHVFYEAYHIAYAIKIAVSNAPVVVSVGDGGYSLPLGQKDSSDFASNNIRLFKKKTSAINSSGAKRRAEEEATGEDEDSGEEMTTGGREREKKVDHRIFNKKQKIAASSSKKQQKK